MFNGSAQAGNLECVAWVSPNEWVTGAQDGSIARWSALKKKPAGVWQAAHGAGAAPHQALRTNGAFSLAGSAGDALSVGTWCASTVVSSPPHMRRCRAPVPAGGGGGEEGELGPREGPRGSRLPRRAGGGRAGGLWRVRVVGVGARSVPRE